jgi:CHAT domain-containing protein
MTSRGRQMLLAAACVAICSLVCWVFWPYLVLWSATRNINQLYSQHRPFAYRWVGAPYGPLQPKLQDAEALKLQSDLNTIKLNVLKVKNRMQLSSRPMQLLGRIELLSGGLDSSRFDNAISQYKLAMLLDPRNMELKLELGIAMALDVKDQSQALQYESSLQQMLEAGRHLENPEIYFDSAILFAEFPMPFQAVDRSMLAVSKEKSSAWRDESVALSSRLRDAMQHRNQLIRSLTTSPDSFLALGENNDVGLELALHTAEVNWLPQTVPSNKRTEALRRLSSLLVSERHDNWLQDMFAKPFFPQEPRALDDLANAIRLNEKGEHLQANKLAASAEMIFEHNHNAAGELRALLEVVYAFDRQSKQNACLSALQRLEPEALRHQYIWIAAQARLEYVTCLTRTRKKDVIAAKDAAYEWVKSTGYEGLALRALGFKAEDYVAADSRLKLWQRGRNGLVRFWQQPLPPLRGYSFYYSLGFDAHKAGDMEASIALLQEGTLLLKDSGINAIRALLLSDLSTWQIDVGMNDEAAATLVEKDREFSLIAPDEAKGFRLESSITLAQELVATGHASDSLVQMQQITNGLPWPYKNLDDNVRRGLLPTLGDAYLKINDLQSACVNDLQAVSEGLEKLASVQNYAQRDNALHQADKAWRGLTEAKLRMGHPDEALYVWELFRSGRNKLAALNPQSLPDCSENRKQIQLNISPGTSVLTYAFLPGGLSSWIVNSSGVHQNWINAKHTRLLAAEFAQLTATPDSPITTISKTSHELHSLLLGPFEKDMPKRGTLVIDCEGILAGIPWAALEDQNQHALVENFAIAQSIGVLNLFQQTLDPFVDLSNTLIFGSPSLGDDLAREYPATIRASLEAIELHRRLPNSLLLQYGDATADAFKLHAQLSTHFHFAGHGISYGGFGALLVASRSQSSSAHYLTAEEISGLNLNRLRTVVLAACSSGIGEQSGIVNLDSLTGAFLEAGVGRVIAAGWDVDDSNTTILMSVFYAGLQQNLSSAEALRRAELAARSKQRHPYFWAGFQVYGQP